MRALYVSEESAKEIYNNSTIRHHRIINVHDWAVKFPFIAHSHFNGKSINFDSKKKWSPLYNHKIVTYVELMDNYFNGKETVKCCLSTPIIIGMVGMCGVVGMRSMFIKYCSKFLKK